MPSACQSQQLRFGFRFYNLYPTTPKILHNLNFQSSGLSTSLLKPAIVLQMYSPGCKQRRARSLRSRQLLSRTGQTCLKRQHHHHNHLLPQLPANPLDLSIKLRQKLLQQLPSATATMSVKGILNHKGVQSLPGGCQTLHGSVGSLKSLHSQRSLSACL